MAGEAPVVDAAGSWAAKRFGLGAAGGIAGKLLGRGAGMLVPGLNALMLAYMANDIAKSMGYDPFGSLMKKLGIVDTGESEESTKTKARALTLKKLAAEKEAEKLKEGRLKERAASKIREQYYLDEAAQHEVPADVVESSVSRSTGNAMYGANAVDQINQQMSTGAAQMELARRAASGEPVDDFLLAGLSV